jgi:hypothetical protein
VAWPLSGCISSGNRNDKLLIAAWRLSPIYSEKRVRTLYERNGVGCTSGSQREVGTHGGRLKNEMPDLFCKRIGS